MSKRKRFLCVAILLLAAAPALVFLWPLHPLEQHADKTFILSRYHAAVYSSAPYQYWKLEPGTEGHAQLLSLAQEYPAHYAPWKALADLSAVYRIDPAFADALWDFASGPDESYGYTPPDGSSLSIPK